MQSHRRRAACRAGSGTLILRTVRAALDVTERATAPANDRRSRRSGSRLVPGTRYCGNRYGWCRSSLFFPFVFSFPRLTLTACSIAKFLATSTGNPKKFWIIFENLAPLFLAVSRFLLPPAGRHLPPYPANRLASCWQVGILNGRVVFQWFIARLAFHWPQTIYRISRGLFPCNCRRPSSEHSGFWPSGR